MTTYSNGKIPVSALKKLSVPGYLLTGAAASFERLRALAKKAGHDIVTSSSADAYRAYSIQEEIFLQRYDHTPRSGLTYNNGGIKNWNGRIWYKKPGVAVAAAPGTSNHGKGLAIDIQGTGGFGGSLYNWLAAHAPAYGWTNTEGRQIGESWHWVYDSSKDQHKSSGSSSSTKKVKPKKISEIKIGYNGGKYSYTVKLWQKFLVSKKYLTSKQVDGLFGRTTDKATRAYQKKAGLVVDGVVGLKTWSHVVVGIKYGSTGPRVEIWQRICGFTSPKADGKFGSQTVSISKQVQAWLGVKEDAVIGMGTITAYRKKA